MGVFGVLYILAPITLSVYLMSSTLFLLPAPKHTGPSQLPGLPLG